MPLATVLRRFRCAAKTALLGAGLLGCAFGGGAGAASDGPAEVPGVAACTADAGSSCAVFADAAGVRREVPLVHGPFTLVDAGPMGRFATGGRPHRYAYLYGTTKGNFGDAEILVIDLDAGRKIAWVSSPRGYGIDTVWFDYIRSPGGQRRPFIAPGAHYLTYHATATGAYGAPAWNFLCLFDPARVARPDPACGTGFTAYSTRFATPQGPDVKVSQFRHGGGWVEDVDGDGWDDINLPFLQYILTVSGKTGRRLALAHFDVAAASEPHAPPYFHSGRFYGRFAVFTEPGTGRRDVLLTDGEAAGYFGGLYCGVSRFVAVAQWRKGPSLALKWSHYLSFAKTIFKPPFASTADAARRGDDLNNCPHFPGTGLVWLAGRPLVAFSLFTEDHPVAACQQQLLAEQKSGFNKEISAAYEFHCAPKEIPVARGHWSVRILDALTGRQLATLPNAYLWGEAPNVAPGTVPTFLVQRFTTDGGAIAYNRTGTSRDALALVELQPGPVLRSLATLAAPPARPAVAGTTYGSKYGFGGGGPAYPPGVGSSYGGISRLALHAVAGAGRSEIELNNGQWLDYSAETGRLSVRSPTPQP